MLTLHRAPVVLPMTGPPLSDGAVLVEGDRILAVGLARDVDAAGARTRAHSGVLVPGLVLPCADLDRGPAPDPADPTRQSSARGAAHALLRAGTTCVGATAPSGPGARAAARAGLLVTACAPGAPAGPDLDPLAAAREQQRAGDLPESLVRSITVDAAARLGLTGPGTLAPGGRADLAVFAVEAALLDPAAGSDPYALLLAAGPGRCTATVLGGRLVHRR